MSRDPIPLGCHLFVGPDRARKFDRIQTFAQALRLDLLDRHRLDGATATTPELLGMCRQRPAVGPGRLVIVDDAQRLSAGCVEALVHHAASIAQTACVVLLVEAELPRRHPLSPYLQGSPSRGGGPIAVERFAWRQAEAAKPFALVDALGQGDVRAALAAWHDGLVAGRDPLELLGLISWQLARWAFVARLLEAGGDPERRAAAVGLRPWQVERIRLEIARRPRGTALALLRRCWQLERDVKRGRTIPSLAVEQLLVETCLSVAAAGPAARPLDSGSGYRRGGLACDVARTGVEESS